MKPHVKSENFQFSKTWNLREYERTMRCNITSLYYCCSTIFEHNASNKRRIRSFYGVQFCLPSSSHIIRISFTKQAKRVREEQGCHCFLLFISEYLPFCVWQWSRNNKKMEKYLFLVSLCKRMHVFFLLLLFPAFVRSGFMFSLLFIILNCKNIN